MNTETSVSDFIETQLQSVPGLNSETREKISAHIQDLIAGRTIDSLGFRVCSEHPSSQTVIFKIDMHESIDHPDVHMAVNYRVTIRTFKDVMKTSNEEKINFNTFINKTIAPVVPADSTVLKSWWRLNEEARSKEEGS